MSLEGHDAIAMPVEKVASNTDEMELQQSPLKKRKIGITAVQKQALMENLQLEIAERARKLRSNYNIHAQSLRTRIEIRVNRIPMSLRKMKMADLLAKYSSIQGEPAATAISARGPPVPEKDNRSPERSIIQKVYPMAPPPPSARPAKRRSDEMSGGDKENEVTSIDNTKKRPRANPAVAPSNQIRNAPTHVLSPTSSNTRTVPRNNNNGQPNSNRAMTPGSIRAGVSRPVSPTKGTTAASNLLHSVVRSTAPRPTILPSPRKPAFPSSAATAAASPRKRGATVGAGPSSRPGTRTADARRVSGTSESSEGSTSTVVKHKRPATAPGDRPPPPKASATSTTTSKKAGAAVMNSLKKAGITASGPATATAAATKKAAAAGAGAAGAGGKSGTEKRVLRKRA